MKKKKLREKCDGCKLYNPECQQGFCCLEKWIYRTPIPKTEKDTSDTS